MNVSSRCQKSCLALAISSLLMASALAGNPSVTINVNANTGKHPISPYIYGVAPPGNGTNPGTLKDLNAPINRYGGNTSSSYNWKVNASNHANDWYFESLAEDTATAGGMADTLISKTRAGNAAPMITIPMLNFVAKLGPDRGRLSSFSIAKYGAQTGNDWEWFADAGDGVSTATGNPNITGNDPNDASTPNSVSLQQSWVNHLIAKWGTAADGGVKYYILDNEHSIWQGTHRDVHPDGPTMAEIGGKMISYGTMIRTADPNAVIIGPEEWGWSGYFYSGADQQYGAAHGWNGVYPDRQAHGNMDYMPWLLQHLKQSEDKTGVRVLDVFSLHCYPQGPEFSDDDSTATQLLRNQSTRQLWDPTYVDQSWIDDTVDLIPRMKGWVASYYPGLKIAITEYNWGDESKINGATTQADIYGIFGREGLDYATRWTTPAASTPTYKAMKMYRNYDGKDSGFGDNSVTATAPQPDDVSAFAATRSSDGALTVMVISKVLTGSTPLKLKIANFAGGASAQEWQLTHTNAITQLASVPVSSGEISVSLPAQSISLFVLPAGGAAVPAR